MSLELVHKIVNSPCWMCVVFNQVERPDKSKIVTRHKDIEVEMDVQLDGSLHIRISHGDSYTVTQVKSLCPDHEVELAAQIMKELI